MQAGTGTGKTLAYLVPAILSGRRTVVATATKALQDQLAGKDLPFLQEHLDRPFTWAVLKGRSNYLCRQRLDEAMDGEVQLSLGSSLDPADKPSTADLQELAEWAETTPTGDRAELAKEPSAATWAAVSTGSDECPGAAKCPRGEDCFAEDARHAAAAADVIVVNTHLYGTNIAAGGAVLPDHELVIFDEAHQLEDTVSETCGAELTAGRFTALAHVVGGIIEDEAIKEGLLGAGDRLGLALAPLVDSRLRRGVSDDLAAVLTAARARLDDAVAALRKIDSDNADVKTRARTGHEGGHDPPGRRRHDDEPDPRCRGLGRAAGSGAEAVRRPPGRGPGLDRVRLGAPDRGADQATIPPRLAEHRRPRPRAGRRDRRRQPLRLRRRRPPLLRRPPARPPQAGLRGGAARGARRP